MNNENTASIYKTWISAENKILPEKFLLKYIRGESSEEREIRQITAMRRLEAEISLLEVRGDRHKANCRKVDEEFFSLLESRYNNDVSEKLKELWIADTKAEESKSLKRWERKQNWLKNYEKEFNNPTLTKQRPKEGNHHWQNSNQKPRTKASNRAKITNKTRETQQQNHDTSHHRHKRTRNTTGTRANHPNNYAARNTRRNTIPGQTHRRFTYADMARHNPNSRDNTVSLQNQQQRPNNANNRERNHFLNPITGRNHIPNERFLNSRNPSREQKYPRQTNRV